VSFRCPATPARTFWAHIWCSRLDLLGVVLPWIVLMAGVTSGRMWTLGDTCREGGDSFETGWIADMEGSTPDFVRFIGGMFSS
jgi:hypothetical protein